MVNEYEKQKLILDVRKKAAEEEIALRERVKRTTENLERQKQNAVLNLAKAGATSLFQLAGANNKAMFALQKAFAIADIIVKGQQAQALIQATIPYPVSLAASASQAALTGIQIATVAAEAVGQAAAGNFENGGIIGGNSFTGDKLTAGVNSGEMILNRSQQQQLFKIANGQNSSMGNGQPINITTKVMLDDQVVGESTSRWVANGGQLGEVQ